VLERLHGVPGVELCIVMGLAASEAPLKATGGAFTFPCVMCAERQSRSGSFYLAGLGRTLRRLRPDVVITVPEYLRSFHFSTGVRLCRRLLGFKLLLKSIPFRLPELDEFRRSLEQRMDARLARPSRWATLWTRCVGRWLPTAVGRILDVGRLVERARRAVAQRRVDAACAKEAFYWRLADGHVNYVPDAYRVYGSYGVRPERIHVIGNSPNTDRLLDIRAELEREGVDRHPHRVIHVGRLVEWKRVDLLLEAVSRLRDSYADLELIVAGEGPMEEAWREMGERLGVSDRVRFMGGVYDTRELGRLLLSSGVYVLAGMGGLSLNDAMCFGCPVICSVCDGTEKALVKDGQTGLFFKDGDAEDLARRLDVLLRDPALQRAMGDAGETLIRNEVNLYSVLTGYVRAFQAATGRDLAGAVGSIAASAAERGCAVPTVRQPLSVASGSNGDG